MTTIAHAVDDTSPVPPRSEGRSGPVPPRSEGRSGPGSHLDRAEVAGSGTYRVPLDWARAEPADGSYDEAVFEGYADACEEARRRNLEPVIVLHHTGLPGWLGPAFWLRLDAPARFGSWAAATVDRFGSYCGVVVTLVEPNAVAWRGFLTGALPSQRVGAVGDLVRALDHMLTGHVVAQAAVDLARPDAVVDLELRTVPVYEVDGLLHDVLAAPGHGVARHDLRPWLTERRRDWYQKRPPPTLAGAVLRRSARSAIPLEQALPRTVAAVYEGTSGRAGDRGHLPASRSL